jgi:hypothetical protein
MNRRTSPQKTADEKAWPIRVCVIVPETGFSGAGIDPHAWLVREFGYGGFALHSAGRIGRDAVAIYFRTLVDVQRFFDAFPTVQLADDTASPLYHSPYVRR